MCTAYGEGDFAKADRAIDKVLREETGIQTTADLPETLAGNAPLLVLEKGMIRLAMGDVDAARNLFVRARDALDQRFSHNTLDYVESSFTDDECLPYRGADSDHLLVRGLLAVCELLRGSSDAYSFALQVDEKQEEILDSPLGTVDEQQYPGTTYRPREHYHRLALGAYLVGILEEADLAAGEANKKFRRALEWSGGSDPLLQESIERTDPGGRFAPPGCGAVHVLYLAGRGPTLTTGKLEGLTDVARLIGAFILVARGKSTGAGWVSQTNIPVPQVVVHDSAVAPLDIHVAGQRVATTSSLADMNQIVAVQLEANMPWIVARAAVRRALKGAMAEGTGIVAEGVAKGSEHVGRYAGFIGLFTKALVGAATTAPERADTRTWSTLPAQIQAARFVLPDGVHQIDLGPGMQATLRVRAGKSSYLLVVRPRADLPGAMIADVASRQVGASNLQLGAEALAAN
ncbi:MAG: hypothetical protein R3F56_00340 [Planctomycetota bacterium]